MTSSHRVMAHGALALLVLAACGGSDAGGPSTDFTLAIQAGNGQVGAVGTALPIAYTVVARDQDNKVVGGVTVTWVVTQGGGSVSSPTSVTDSTSGTATVTHTLGPVAGPQSVTASAAGLIGSPVTFIATAGAGFTILGGGNNVTERFTSDLWVHGNYAYTGTWGFRTAQGSALKVWQLGATGAPTLVDSIITAGIGTVSDVEVSSDGALLVFSAENGGNAGLHLYSLADPAHPVFIAKYLVSTGLHTATFGYIGGKRYIFAAKNPDNPALVVFEIDPVAPSPIALVTSVAVPANYGHHDTFVRNGLAFVCAWNTGVRIYSVGDSVDGGPSLALQLISTIATAGGQVHNAWWFHNPVTNEKKYLFVGQEGPGIVGASSSGDIHVVDVSNLANPVEVASYHLNGAGTHNFWVDEPRQVLYAAYYNGGVVALDVSGTLSGNLADREIARIAPGGSGNTFTWGVMLYNGYVYASDMLSGLWQLGAP